MLKLKNGTIYNREFIHALKELSKLDLDIKVAYNLTKIIKGISRQAAENQDFLVELENRYLKRDDLGKLIPDGNSPEWYMFREDIPDAQEKYDLEQKSFREMDIEIPGNTLCISDLPPRITAKLLLHIEPILQESMLEIVED